jgi:hypothetical protein
MLLGLHWNRLGSLRAGSGFVRLVVRGVGLLVSACGKISSRAAMPAAPYLMLAGKGSRVYLSQMAQHRR